MKDFTVITKYFDNGKILVEHWNTDAARLRYGLSDKESKHDKAYDIYCDCFRTAAEAKTFAKLAKKA